MKLSVIIVNYNVRYFLEQALWSVRKASKGLSLEIFVVDNNSVDDSVEMVREKFPEVQLIVNKDNVGFSTANNQAIREAKGEYILLLNPDTVVEEDTFVKCVSFMDAKTNGGALGVKMIDGSGKFLPESKRGFPSPKVAFAKTFGLSKLFPKSKLFNHYHLGYLDENQTHEIEVLAGAFMLLRKSVLDEVGLLDESFFMYGEDIDLSYRIVKAGYKNYYFPETKIIHYKGESTKKGSLNYVKVFYQAMIIFAKKHFSGEQAWLYILMLQLAIYFRASLTLIGNVIKRIYLPLIDAGLIFIGMVLLKNFWAVTYFEDPDYYGATFIYFNIPLYISIWLLAMFLSGAYDQPSNFGRLIKGLIIGSLILAAVYGFLPMDYRTSRMLLLLGAIWAFMATSLTRILRHFIKYRDLNFGESRIKNFIIVAGETEKNRVLALVNQLQLKHNFIGWVSPNEEKGQKDFLSNIQQLDEVVRIYKLDEIIFCSKDLSAQKIMYWMSVLGTEMSYKIVPEESLTIIGSHSKNSSGELYTIDIEFRIAQFMNKRNKRLLDLIIALFFLILSPLLIWGIKNKGKFIRNIFQVLFGSKSWVGYFFTNDHTSESLPSIKEGVLTPVSSLHLTKVQKITADRLNFIYARDYTMERDLVIILKGIKDLGN